MTPALQYGARVPRSFFERTVVQVAGDLLGRVLVTGAGDHRVAVRLTEVEAYAGQDDPASHAYRGRTTRNAVMFGPAGHLYTYFVYGMHWCANIVTGDIDVPQAVLLRAGHVVDGHAIARARRGKKPDGSDGDQALARGPAGLATTLGLGAAAYGSDLCEPAGWIGLYGGSPPPRSDVGVGPRTGVAAAADMQNRYWIIDDPTVSPFRVWSPRSRTAGRRPT